MPEIHTVRGKVRKLRQNAAPRMIVMVMDKESSMNELRQKATSKLRAASRWRVTTPAVLHMKATNTINNTARVWVIDQSAGGSLAWVGRPWIKGAQVYLSSS